MKIGEPADPNATTPTNAIFRRQLLLPIIFSIALVIISYQNYLIFHVLSEFFAVGVAVMMFVVVWHTYGYSRNHFLMFLGAGYFWIGGLDVIHTLLYYGMPTALDKGNFTSQFWISTRFLEALLLLFAPLFIAKIIDRRLLLTLFGIVALVTTGAILSGAFPDTFIEGVGLTTFKVVSEYLIISIMLAAIFHFRRRRHQIDPHIYLLMIVSIGFTIGAELAFTFYVDMYGISNLVGHIFKIFSYWMIYVAIIRTSLTEPFRILNNELRKEIEERRHIESNLQDTQALHEEAQQLAKLGHWSLDISSNELYWSNEIFRIFGIDAKRFDASYDAFIEAIHPDDRDYVNNAYQESLATKKPYDIVHRLQMKDGTIKYVHERCKTYYDDEDNPLRSTGTVQDITVSVLAENALKASEERFELAMRAANDGLWDWDMLTNAVYYSPRWKSMLGYRDDELSNELSTWKKLTDDAGKTRTMALVDECIAGEKEGFVSEFRMQHKDGHWLDIQSRSILVRDEQGKPLRMVGTHADLSDRKQAERTLIEKEKAETAARMKSQFLANMSHELRTPMNGIIGMTHLALQTKLDEKQKNYIDKAHSSATSLLGILNDILDFSKIEAGKLELEQVDFQLKDVIDNMVNLIRLEADEKQIQLSISIGREAPRQLHGDPLRLSQVLINLGANAVKFSNPGDKVALQVNLVERHDSDVLLEFAVEDTGIGISAEQQQRLFQPFSQADNSTTREYGGTGLGLIISQKIVELMGGNIEVKSEPGVGSRFSFTIKLKKHQNETVALESTTSNDGDAAIARLRNARILLVEDNDINQELVQELLLMNGLSVETANNGQEALEKLAEQTFDGVLMDCQMPIMDGYEATRKIREQEKYKELPILALTANAMKGDKEKVLEAGLNDHISKPVDPDEMFATMAKWIKPKLSTNG